MTNFTCLTCCVIFGNADIQREHYKTDWHRYNLKRKLVNLQPVTEEEFQQKVAFQTQKKDEKVGGSKRTTMCETCNKKFSTEKAYENHVRSKKHRDQEAKGAMNKEKRTDSNIANKNKKNSDSSKPCVKPKRGYMPPMEDDDMDDDDSDEWEDIEDDEEIIGSEDEIENEESEAIPQNHCLFCTRENSTIEANMKHMSRVHSFFIPDLDFVTDLEGFLIYLGAKVGDGKICLRCNDHSRQFRSVEACKHHMIDKGHCMIDYDGDAVLEYADFYDFSSSYPDHMESINEDDEISLHDHSLSMDPNTMELVLPNGSRIGHRALKKYYQQNVQPEHFQKNNRAMIKGVNSQYKAIGLTGTTLTLAIRKKIVAQKFENQNRASQRLRLGVKANNMQFHFRKQVMNCG